MKARDLAYFVLHKITEGEDLNNVLKKIEAYLEKVNRQDLYPLVLTYTKTLLSQKASKDSVRIVSPYDIQKPSLKLIVEKLTDEKVTHTEEIDADMIGGFEAEYKDRTVGVNFKSNIEAFKKHLSR